MPITHDEFIKKYNGKFVEVAGSANAKNQCVDLVNAYLREVLDQPIVEWTNARDFPSKLTENFDWFNNDPDAIPKQGDLIVWQHNEAGHIAICDTASLNEFHSFDQNYPTGTPCHIQRHTYLRPKVAGWLRLKYAGEPKIYSEAQMTAMREQRDDNHRKYIASEEVANDRKKQLREFIEKLAIKLGLPLASDESDVLGSVERLIVVEDELTKANSKLDKQQSDFERKEKDWEKKLSDIQQKLEDQAQEIVDLKEEVNQVLLAHEELKSEKPSLTPHKTRFSRFIDWILAWVNK